MLMFLYLIMQTYYCQKNSLWYEQYQVNKPVISVFYDLTMSISSFLYTREEQSNTLSTHFISVTHIKFVIAVHDDDAWISHSSRYDINAGKTC